MERGNVGSIRNPVSKCLDEGGGRGGEAPERLQNKGDKQSPFVSHPVAMFLGFHPSRSGGDSPIRAVGPQMRDVVPSGGNRNGHIKMDRATPRGGEERNVHHLDVAIPVHTTHLPSNRDMSTAGPTNQNFLDPVVPEGHQSTRTTSESVVERGGLPSATLRAFASLDTEVQTKLEAQVD